VRPYGATKWPLHGRPLTTRATQGVRMRCSAALLCVLVASCGPSKDAAVEFGERHSDSSLVVLPDKWPTADNKCVFDDRKHMADLVIGPECSAHGVRCRNCVINGSVSIKEGGPEIPVIDLSLSTIQGDLSLRNAKLGALSLLRTHAKLADLTDLTVSGDADLSHAEFDLLEAPRMEAKGYLRLFAAQIAGSANLSSLKSDDLNAEGFRVGDTLSLQGATLGGEAHRAPDPKKAFESQKDCVGALYHLSIHWDQCQQINFSGVTAKIVMLSGASLLSPLSLGGAHVEDTLDLADIDHRQYLNFHNLQVHRLVVTKLGPEEDAAIDLGAASIEVIVDQAATQAGFKEFVSSSADATSVLSKLEASLRKEGRPADADYVFRSAWSKRGPAFAVAAFILHGPLVAYLVVAVLYLACSVRIFTRAMSGLKDQGIGEAIWYSIDMFLPSPIELNVKGTYTSFEPGASKHGVRAWILVGWVILTCFVFAAVSYVKVGS
jgi:hypothetical protein